MTSILIIDDDVALLANLAALLEDAAFTVIKSSDLTHGAILCAEQRPDLVILEVHMGGNAGWALLDRLALDVPVLVLSQLGREEDVVRGFAAGAMDYVAKPYRSAELLARIRARMAPTLALAVNVPPPDRAPFTVAAPPVIPPVAGPKRDPEPTDVFMSEAEELALLRTPPPPLNESARALPDEPPQTLGGRLRAERMRRQYTLVQVENDLKIRMSYLQAMEDEKFTLLPRGPVALQMVHTYAGHLGMPADTVLEEFRQHFYIEPVTPPTALGGPRMPRSIPRWLIWITAIILALSVAVGLILTFDPNFFTLLPERVQPLLPTWSWENLTL